MTHTELYLPRTFVKVYDSETSDMHPHDFMLTSEYYELIARVDGRPEHWSRLSRRRIGVIDIEGRRREIEQLSQWPVLQMLSEIGIR
jgi:hypothetical protein